MLAQYYNEATTASFQILSCLSPYHFTNHTNNNTTPSTAVTALQLNTKIANLSLCMPPRHIVAVDVQSHTFFTSALDSGKWWTSSPSRYSTGKEPQHPLHRMLGGLQCWSGYVGEEKSLLSLPRLKLQTIQPQLNHYTDWDFLTHAWHNKSWQRHSCVLLT
jgi:hypothetical protein